MADPLKGYEQIDTVYIDNHEIAAFNEQLLSYIDSMYYSRRIKDVKIKVFRDCSDTIRVDIYAKFYEENEMNTEEQIKQEIKDAQKALERAQKKLAELENNKKYGWWKPEDGKLFFLLDNANSIDKDVYIESSDNYDIVESLNCFKTEEEAELEQLQIIIRRKIQDIALRLNKGRKIDWDDDSQKKYRSCIYYNSKIKELSVSTAICNRQAFYHPICLDKDFGEVIYNELKDDLKRYFELQRELA